MCLTADGLAPMLRRYCYTNIVYLCIIGTDTS